MFFCFESHDVLFLERGAGKAHKRAQSYTHNIKSAARKNSSVTIMYDEVKESEYQMNDMLHDC